MTRQHRGGIDVRSSAASASLCACLHEHLADPGETLAAVGEHAALESLGAD